MFYLTPISKGLMNFKVFKPYFLNNQTRLLFKHDIDSPETAPLVSLMEIIKQYQDQSVQEMTLFFRAETLDE